MKRETITRMLDMVDEQYISEAAIPDFEREGPERIVHMKKKRIITLVLAAALLIALGVTAYAGGWFDRKQVVIVEPRSTKEPEAEEIEIVDGETETIEITGEEMGEEQRMLTPYVPPEEERRVSVTQALAVPDDLDAETYARASNTVAAYNEFLAWVFEQEPEPEEPTAILNKRAEQGWEALTEEEQQTIRDWNKEMTEYHQRMFAEQERVKKQIMEKHGLKERRVPETGNLLWSWETVEASDLDWFGEVRRDYRAMDGMLSNRELMDWISENYCHGDYFAAAPVGFDKVYWLPDGDFCVSYYLDLQQEGYLNWTGCYAYCSSYEVFHDGWEVGTWLNDGVNTTERSYTAADGTELTIIRAGKQAVIYAFLPDYFFTETVWSTVELDDAMLDIIAESINYQNIGK
ncbi:MAG: hypothetical protein IJK35_04435 [Oscillospiraceae bacterium]|nr:hypothetical protein [Oscillospiraceae bacterium]